MEAATGKPAVSEGPPNPTVRGPAAALLIGSAALIGALLICDLYGVLPPDLLAPFASFGPPAGVLLVIVVLAEGLSAAYLVSAGAHPLDGPFITHYGTRTIAAGGVAVAGGIVAYITWATAIRHDVEGAAVVMDGAVVAMLVGAALLLSGFAVLASAVVSPWIVRRAA